MGDSTAALLGARLPMLGSGVEVHDKCGRCGGKCCTYFALQIDSPRRYEEFDDIRWYVSHHGVQVFQEGRRWYLQVEVPCDHLSRGGLCDIYEKRPKICRDHKVDGCEFENDEPFGYKVHFKSSEEVDAYMLRRWPRGRPEGRRKRRVLPRSMRLTRAGRLPR